VQISNITSLNAPGLATLVSTQIGTPLVLDSNNNILKNKSFYALYTNYTNDSSTSGLKLFRMSFGEYDTYSAAGSTLGKAYYLFNHLLPRASSTFTLNWVGDTSSTVGGVTSKPYLKLPCLGYWSISFSTFTSAASSTYFQIIYIRT
jgi:hypothetical protein